MAVLKTYAALLRGINVGGARTLPMRDLEELVRTLGHEDVQTYIQSGNVVFRAAGTSSAGLADGLERAITDRFGLDVRVIIRTPAELTRIVADSPYPVAENEPSRLHVVYLDRPPKAAEVAKLDPERSPGDAFAVLGREIYLHLPNGLGRSKLTLDYFERRLGVAGTARNWNTLLKLIELTAPGSPG